MKVTHLRRHKANHLIVGVISNFSSLTRLSVHLLLFLTLLQSFELQELLRHRQRILWDERGVIRIAYLLYPLRRLEQNRAVRNHKILGRHKSQGRNQQEVFLFSLPLCSSPPYFLFFVSRGMICGKYRSLTFVCFLATTW